MHKSVYEFCHGTDNVTTKIRLLIGKSKITLKENNLKCKQNHIKKDCIIH